MANVVVYNMEGKEVGTIELSDAVFGVEVNEHLVHMAVVFSSLPISVRETQKAKTRSEVSAAEESPGDRREPAMRDRVQPELLSGRRRRGFAPVPRDYSFKLNRKEKKAALKSALTSRVQANKLIVVDELKFDGIKTKNFKQVMDNLKVEKGLVVLNENDANVVLSARNLPRSTRR